MTPDYGFASGREAEKASRKWQVSFNARLKAHNLVFYYLDTPQTPRARTWPEIMDLLASETARLVLSYTLDQHLPATSKQLVSRLLMTLLNCHPLGNLTKLSTSLTSGVRVPAPCRVGQLAPSSVAQSLKGWRQESPRCPQRVSGLMSHLFFFLLNSSLIIRTLLTQSQK